MASSLLVCLGNSLFSLFWGLEHVAQGCVCRDRGSHTKAIAVRKGREASPLPTPPTAVEPMSPRVHLSQIHHCDSQAHKLILPEVILTLPFNFLKVFLYVI